MKAFLLLLVTLAGAQENPMPMGLLCSRASLVQRQDVQVELGLDGDLVAKVQEKVKNLGSVPVGNAATGSLPVFIQLDDSIKPLFTEDQWKRLNQIWFQFEGPFVLTNLDVSAQLDVKPEVGTKIDEIAKDYSVWWHKEIARVRDTKGLNRIKGEARKQGQKILKLLTPEQKKKFEELQGPKFRFRS